ncbi:MAG: hydantoinase/oxoprolinase family protein [Actinobacteria bacterium]|nr:hydantoinase/oxoprolinase family protein [Actinomycetota bacterium]
MTHRFAVDVGGTFTDLVLYDDAVGWRVEKASTTPAAPEQGVSDVLRHVADEGLVARSPLFLHGNTVALNALLERDGARLGLLATRGFRDVLEIAHGDRGAIALDWRPSPSLVPRRRRLVVTERVAADGSVLTPLVEADVADALDTFRAADVEAIAVALLNAYANPVHELEVERQLRALGFDGEISLSHRLSRELREYERTSTTVVDAFVRPKVSGYLQRLGERLEQIDFSGHTLLASSSGGAMTVGDARQRPFETTQSGPVGGVAGAARLAADLGLESAIAADLGGTSFDACLITDGRPRLRHEGEVAGMPLQIPWVDIRSIGAGGGSLAYLDEGGLLRVGPQSAGAMPGPACYGRGGSQPTVTDAAAALGMLGRGKLAGGVALDFAAAAAALRTVGEPIGMDAEQLAQGVLEIVTAHMADALREVTIEEGRDPREATLIAFGGAGPLFATLLCDELDLVGAIVPPLAGNFSAWGLMQQDVVRGASRTVIAPLEDAALATVGSALAESFEELLRDPFEEGGEPQLEATVDLRYDSQSHTLTVPLQLAADGGLRDDAGTLASRFTEEHRRAFGHVLDGEAMRVTAVRASVRVPLPPVDLTVTDTRPASAPPEDETVAFSFRRGERCAFRLVERAHLAVGDRVAGPAILTEPTTTTYLDAGFSAEVLPTGALTIKAEER